MANSPSPRSTPAPPSDDRPPSSGQPPTTTPTPPNLALPDRSQGQRSTETAAQTPNQPRSPARQQPHPDPSHASAPLFPRRPSVQFVPSAARDVGPSVTGWRSSSARPNPPPKLDGPPRRMSSPPPPAQFRPSVSFDTFANPAASDFSLTLNRKHRAYEYTKRSRTFLCGTDANGYSDTALEWLVDELVDDGDEVVCLRVVERDSREAARWAGGHGERGYRDEAERFLEGIVRKNTEDRAISLVLEFAVGKVPDTIQQMIRIYEPAILVVGTRGRSLTGYQGLLSSGSVSKYCLQYSPVPVIVVRPSSKRESKKRKRMQDPARTGYRDILDKSEDAPRGRGGHLLDQKNRNSVTGADMGVLGRLTGTGDPDEEARRVAEAIGYRQGRSLALGGSGDARPSSASGRTSSAARSPGRSSDAGDPLASPKLDGGRLLKSPELRDEDSPVPSDDDDDGDEDDVNHADDVGRPHESVVRPEDEAAMLAYERAVRVREEEDEEAEARRHREEDRAKGKAGRSVSRGRKDGDDEGGGAAVLGLLAQLDRGMK